MGNYLGAAATGRTRSVPVAMPLTHRSNGARHSFPVGRQSPRRWAVVTALCSLVWSTYKTEPIKALLPVIVPGYGSES